MVYQANKTDSGAQVFQEIDGKLDWSALFPVGKKPSQVAHRKENTAQRNVQDT